jgi:bacterioferritin-associated ferredoxin
MLSFSRFLISSSYQRDQDFQWGSHPRTDPLMSASHLAIEHYGADFDRVEKTELVARHSVVLRHLRVCYRAGTAANCGKCGKCFRTMLALEMLGCLPKATAFPNPVVDIQKARRMMLDSDSTAAYLLRHAIARGRPDIVKAIRATQRWNRRREFSISLATRFEKVPGFNSMLGALSRHVQKGALE